MEERAREEEAMAIRASGAAAFEHAFAAADYYMKAAQKAQNSRDRARLRLKFNELVTLAEALKDTSKVKLENNTATSPLTFSGELAILQKSAYLHGCHFAAWSSDPNVSEFASEGPHDLYFDDATFTMSARQREVLAGWKRPNELFGGLWQQTGTKRDNMLMRAKNDSDLVQDITTDCSVVASMCAAMKQLQPGDRSLLGHLMYPFDYQKGHPAVSPSGKYIFRMHFNGCFRAVVIDDRLPASKTDRALYVVDRQNPSLIWPALMEKAYLKVRGGYDFPGSNSGTDLRVLTGWIPEQIFLQSEDLDIDNIWKGLVASYRSDNVMITLGTGRLTVAEERSLGLVGEHDYAVLDVSSARGDRRLLVKNPWCDGPVWKDRRSSPKQDFDLRTSSYPADALATHDPPGSFWISLEDVAQNFESMYLNWNPSLFSFRQDKHFNWAPPKNTLAKTLVGNPQFSVTASNDNEVLVLLSRHFADAELSIAKQKSQSLAATSKKLGFMSIYLFDKQGYRAQLPESYAYRGPYVDSPQVLAKFNAKKGASHTVVVAQQGLPLSTYSFTLSFFSNVKLHVKPAREKLAFCQEITGSWTRRTAGGNASSSSYSKNPQFSISIQQKSPLSLLLTADCDTVAVHVDLIWANGERVHSITTKEIIGTSGDYRLGCALAEIPAVDAGTYTVVCSTFEPGQFSDFNLRIGSDVPTQVKPVMGIFAGWLLSDTQQLHFRDGEEQYRASLRATRLTRACVTAKYADASPASNTVIRISVFYGKEPNEKRIAVSGGDTFEEPTCSVKTSEFDIEPESLSGFEGLWVAVEQMGSHGAKCPIDIGILSDNPVAIGPWKLVDL